MRIIAGTLKGRQIPTSRLREARPTTDRARETMFNILNNTVEIEDTDVLDICAGSGALGFEALSRGAKSCVFIEKNKQNADVIRQSAKEFGVENQITVKVGDAREELQVLSQFFSPFHLVFCDPPYALKLLNSIVLRIHQQNLLASEGIVVAEHAPHESVLLPPTWERIGTRNFGETIVDFFQNNQ